MPQMANRVQETTTTGGTGTITLGGAVTGYLTFASSFATSSVLFYTIDNGVGEWEIGIGTLVTTGTLSRDTVIASSNGGALVNFASGTKRVFCSAPTHSLVPDQTSKSGYVLTTDGTNPSWTQTLNGITIGNTTPAAGAFTTLSASSTVSGTGFSTYLASPPAIGGTTPAAGNFTTLGATGNVTLGDAAGDTLTINAGTTTFAQGTANGVLYLNGSKVLTTGSALTFNGTNLGIGTNSPFSFAKLTLEQAGADCYLALKKTGGSSSAYISTDGSTLWFGSALGSTGKKISLDLNAPDGAMNINSAGNLGLGVTPSGWYSLYKTMQLGMGATLSGRSDTGVWTELNANLVRAGDAVWRYLNNDVASQYIQSAGSHSWGIASTGTQGAQVSWTGNMSFDSSGLVLKQANNTANTSVSLNTTVQNALTLDSSGNLISYTPTTAPSLGVNNTMVFNLTSNTNLRVSVRGSDGVTRTANITLA